MRSLLLPCTLVLATLVACGPVPESTSDRTATRAQGLTSANGLVTLEAVGTGRPYTFATAQVGTPLYIDRTYTLTGLSSRLQGGVLLQAANDDKLYAGASQVRLGLNSAATVYVAMDWRNTVLPAWLADGTWALTDEVLATNDPSATTPASSTPMKVYVKSLPAGTLTLGGGMASPAQGTNAQYVVILKFTGSEPGVVARFFPNIRMQGVPVLRHLSTVDVYAGTGAPVDGIPADFFGVRLEGFVTPAFTQTYTFRTAASGGVRLWINGRLLVDDWFEHAGVEQRTGSIPLAADVPASVVLEFFDAEALASVLLQWQSASQPWQTIPVSRLEAAALPLPRPLGAHCTAHAQCRSGTCSVFPVGNVTIWNEGDAVCTPEVPEGQPGVKAEYFTSEFLYNRAVVRREDFVGTFWSATAPVSGVPADRWSARWSATLTAPTSGTYTLRTSTEDGVRLWLDGSLLVDDWMEAEGGQTHDVSVVLTANSPHALVMEFFEGHGNAHARLSWSGPGIPWQTVTTALSTPPHFTCRPLGSQCRSNEDCCGAFCSVSPVGNVTLWNEGATVCSPR
ncbi:PA14 domain-containing protein [Corallococcus sp. CA047B]|uniref:PA14 domain-containing protein n=1 Tax=Corallococcus sp. CA047B TaxID=2316729 RepID=UPI001315466D|nr:PA14 domain-containing protein [Corallococcus sp. CA047B]